MMHTCYRYAAHIASFHWLVVVGRVAGEDFTVSSNEITVYDMHVPDSSLLGWLAVASNPDAMPF